MFCRKRNRGRLAVLSPRINPSHRPGVTNTKDGFRPAPIGESAGPCCRSGRCAPHCAGEGGEAARLSGCPPQGTDGARILRFSDPDRVPSNHIALEYDGSTGNDARELVTFGRRQLQLLRARRFSEQPQRVLFVHRNRERHIFAVVGSTRRILTVVPALARNLRGKQRASKGAGLSASTGDGAFLWPISRTVNKLYHGAALPEYRVCATVPFLCRNFRQILHMRAEMLQLA